ncbi:MAG: helix-turn-helix transcriptional regulator [Alphaproteobacteria bacterium]|nr:helix-turn-helix transcriptional regulator [Alphaproteobacteria bacterium]
MGRTADYSRQACPIAATLEVVGDPWTLLILRDAFNGIRRFEQWQERLGVARNVLASRLKTLVANGVLRIEPYSERPPRHEYLLTPKGRDLRPVLLTMYDWGEQHVYGEGQAPNRMVHDGHPFRPKLVCATCDVAPGDRDVRRVDQDIAIVTVGEALARQAD